jgi:PAS domain S-box-containing protein
MQVAIPGVAKQLVAITEIARALAQPSDLDEVFDAVRQHLEDLLGADVFVLALYDETSQTIQVARQAEHGVNFPGGSFPLGSGFTSQVITTRKPQLIRRWSADGPPIGVRYATAEPRLPESAVAVPLEYGREVLGVLTAYAYPPNAFDDDDLQLLCAAGAQTATAIASLRHSDRADLQIQRRISELEAILASMADALVVVDRDRRIIRLNRAARELLAGSQGSLLFGQALGSPHGEHWPAGAPEIAAVLGPMSETLQRGEVPEEREVQTHRGGKRTLSFTGSPLRYGRGQLGGGVIIGRDVTTRREIDELKDEVLAIASHDLRTPLTVIKAQAQIVMRSLHSRRATRAGIEASLESINNQVDHLTRLLALLMDLSRIEAGRLELLLTPVDLRELVSRTVQSMQLTTDRHQIELYAPEPVVVGCDEHRIQEVLENLLGNAIKYSPKGSVIEVQVRTEQHGASISVRDNGVGLGQDALPHVFDRFYRAEGARTLEGAGLGLYICRAVVEAHGGRLWAESDGPGTGATFTAWIPLEGPDGSTLSPS